MEKEKLISVIISLIYLIVASIYVGIEGALKTLTFLVLPIACIWFSEAMGDWVGFFGRANITKQTPGCLVKFMGWILLLLPAIIFIFQILNK